VFASFTDPLLRGDAADRRLAEIQTEGAQVAAEISRLQARLVELAAEAARLEGRLVGMTPRAWVTWRFGLTPTEGGRVMRLADRLPALPKLADAFATGRLSEGVVDTLSAAATPTTEAELLDLSTVATGAQLQTLVRDHQRAVAGTAESPSPHRRAFLSSTPGDDGWWDLRGRLSPRDGAVVDAAVRAAVDTAKVPEAPWPTTADGLVRVADAFLTGTAADGSPVPERFETVVVVDRDGPVLRGTGPIDRDTFGEILCESTVSAVLRQHGRAVIAAVPRRYASRRQLRALWVRDRCCRFPGCGRANGLIAHHLQPWHEGGPTVLDNLVLLCRAHHRVIHQRGWTITRSPDDDNGDGRGSFRFTRPDGTTVDPACRRPDAGSPLPGPANRGTSPDGDGPTGETGEPGDLGETGEPDGGPEPPGGVPRRPGDRGPRSPSSPRHIGLHEDLTEFGRDVILHNWLTSERRADRVSPDHVSPEHLPGEPPPGEPPVPEPPVPDPPLTHDTG
jgi:hypothetical protein